MLQYFLNRGIKIKTYIFILLSSLLVCQSVPYFDEHRAFDYLVQQCDIGPRFPGSVGHDKMKDYLIDSLSLKLPYSNLLYSISLSKCVQLISSIKTTP